jgi:predicted transcriptional regulator
MLPHIHLKDIKKKSNRRRKIRRHHIRILSAKKRSTKATKHIGARNNTVYIQPKKREKKKK